MSSDETLSRETFEHVLVLPNIAFEWDAPKAARPSTLR